MLKTNSNHAPQPTSISDGRRRRPKSPLAIAAACLALTACTPDTAPVTSLTTTTSAPSNEYLTAKAANERLATEKGILHRIPLELNSRLLDESSKRVGTVATRCLELEVTGPNETNRRDDRTTPVHVKPQLTDGLDPRGAHFYTILESSPDGNAPLQQITTWSEGGVRLAVENGNTHGLITAVAYDIQSTAEQSEANAHYPSESGIASETRTQASICPVYRFDMDATGAIAVSPIPNQ